MPHFLHKKEKKKRILPFEILKMPIYYIINLEYFFKEISIMDYDCVLFFAV